MVTMTWVGYLSQVGGLLGVCIGFSLVSAVELLYWFIVKMARTFGKKKVKQDSVVEEENTGVEDTEEKQVNSMLFELVFPCKE